MYDHNIEFGLRFSDEYTMVVYQDQITLFLYYDNIMGVFYILSDNTQIAINSNNNQRKPRFSFLG